MDDSWLIGYLIPAQKNIKTPMFTGKILIDG